MKTLTFLDKKGKERMVDAPVAPVADTHTHIFGRETPLVPALSRAKGSGVDLVVSPIDPTREGADVQDIVRQLEKIEATPQDELPITRILAGAHPYHAREFLETPRDSFDALLGLKACAGIGEIGLDYTCDVSKDIQREAFVEQLRVAHARHLPVELHIRDANGDENVEAHVDALDVLQKEGIPQAGCVLHCFTQDTQVMQPFVDAGCVIAFGGALTFKKSEDIRAAAVACPLDQMVTETDAPYMAPEPLRGLPCEPAYVVIVADTLGKLKYDAGLATVEETMRACWNTATRLFLPE